MDIYSRTVNAQKKLETVLEETFPWCKQWAAELKKLFDGYVDRKEAGGINLLDYGCIRIFPASFVGGVVELYEGLKADDMATSGLVSGSSKSVRRIDRRWIPRIHRISGSDEASPE